MVVERVFILLCLRRFLSRSLKLIRSLDGELDLYVRQDSSARGLNWDFTDTEWKKR